MPLQRAVVRLAGWLTCVPQIKEQSSTEHKSSGGPGTGGGGAQYLPTMAAISHSDCPLLPLMLELVRQGDAWKAEMDGAFKLLGPLAKFRQGKNRRGMRGTPEAAGVCHGFAVFGCCSPPHSTRRWELGRALA